MGVNGENENINLKKDSLEKIKLKDEDRKDEKIKPNEFREIILNKLKENGKINLEENGKNTNGTSNRGHSGISHEEHHHFHDETHHEDFDSEDDESSIENVDNQNKPESININVEEITDDAEENDIQIVNAPNSVNYVNTEAREYNLANFIINLLTII